MNDSKEKKKKKRTLLVENKFISIELIRNEIFYNNNRQFHYSLYTKMLIAPFNISNPQFLLSSKLKSHVI